MLGFASLIRAFSLMLFLVAGAMMVPLFVALLGQESVAGGYGFGVVVTLAAGVSAFAVSMTKHGPVGLRGILFLVLLLWTIIPVFAAIPLAGEEMSFFDAYFDAVAALTTTGGWLSIEGALETQAGAVWRAMLQWLGGLASIAIAAAIFIRPSFIGTDTLLPPFSRGENDSFLRPIYNAFRAFFFAYLALTCFSFFICLTTGAPFFDAAILSLSIPASGGFAPHVNGLSHYPILLILCMTPLIFISGSNFIVVERILRGAFKQRKDIETVTYFSITIFAGIAFWLSIGASDFEQLVWQGFNAISLLSTNGFIIGETPPLIIVMITAIIGGCAVSSAGGFKILRWIVIMNRARAEIRKLILPNAVAGLRSIANELGVWMHFLVFTIFLAVLLICLSVSGYSFELSVVAATSALSNTGPLVYLTQGAQEGYGVFNDVTRALLLIGMVLGRLEAAVALALINQAFWRS